MDQVKIGKFIAELRREAEMTQEQLGRKLGVTNKTVSRWENGNYMPDIETFLQLSSFFDVSVNELLCGKRLSEGEFRQKADDNLVAVWSTGSFSAKERSRFWKKKWLGEHAVSVTACAAAALAVFVWAWSASVYWLAGLCPLGWLALAAFLRNRMMIYVENRVFPAPGCRPSAPEKHVVDENLHADSD